MLDKKPVDKLTIMQQEENIYVLTWYCQEAFVWTEKRFFTSSEEKLDIENIINHKKDCCFVIENIEVLWQ